MVSDPPSMRADCDTHTIRLIYEGFVESGRLSHETDGTSEFAQWHSLPAVGLDLMPFVLGAIAAKPEIAPGSQHWTGEGRPGPLAGFGLRGCPA